MTRSWSDAYGVPEWLWIGWWTIIVIAVLVAGARIYDYRMSLLASGGIWMLAVLLPQATLRMGDRARTGGRVILSAASAVTGYERAGDFIAVFREESYELEMLAADQFLFGGNPSEWFEAIYHPALSEYFQVVYITYFPQLLLVGIAILVLGKRRLFYEYLVTMNIAIMLNHLLYVLVPVRSPFLIHELGLYQNLINYTADLDGLWLFDSLRQGLLDATTMRHDCFPSGHTMHSLLAVWFAWRAHRIVGVLETVVGVSIVVSTLYLRYHYAIDLVAALPVGVAAAATGVWLTRRHYEQDPNADASLVPGGLPELADE